jgi:phage terminase large subunit-like protein
MQWRGLLRRAARVLGSDPAAWERFVGGLPGPVQRAMAYDFFGWQAHGGQSEPAGAWAIWLMMAGRGFGKTRAGAEWVSARARETPGARIALVGATVDEVAKVMIEGPSGLIAVARDEEEMLWVPTQGVVSFAGGAQAFVYSAAAAEKLRGPEHHFAWADELAKWEAADAALDNLMMGMRLGENPRVVVTTTPRGVGALRRLRAMPGVVETGGATAQNRHLPGAFKAWVEATYGGTRLGRQELEGVLFEAPEGALFPRELLERARVVLRDGASPGSVPPQDERGFWRRVVVGVDPPASAHGDACGIVVCALGSDGVAYVLADRSVAGKSPEGWARSVAAAAAEWGADRVVAEKNQGGEMVGSVLRSVEAGLPLRLVSASRGKVARAEPVAARMETGRVKLAGAFPELEDELAGLMVGGGYEPGSRSGPGGPGRSPDRADACVWALAELIGSGGEPRVVGL